MNFNEFLDIYLNLQVDTVQAGKIEAAYQKVRGIPKAYVTSSNNSYAMGILHGHLDIVGSVNTVELVNKLWQTDVYTLPYRNDSGYEDAILEWCLYADVH